MTSGGPRGEACWFVPLHVNNNLPERSLCGRRITFRFMLCRWKISRDLPNHLHDPPLETLGEGFPRESLSKQLLQKEREASARTGRPDLNIPLKSGWRDFSCGSKGFTDPDNT